MLIFGFICMFVLNFKDEIMFIAWYWLVLIVVLVGYYIYYIKRECRARRRESETLLQVIRRWREKRGNELS